MLRGEFYTMQPAHDGGTFSVTLQPTHPIFEGHFPDRPIVPGVCILQICKELCEHIYDKELTITHVRNVKFLQMLTPLEHREIQFVLRSAVADDQTVDLRATVEHKGITFTKLHMALSPHRLQ